MRGPTRLGGREVCTWTKEPAGCLCWEERILLWKHWAAFLRMFFTARVCSLNRGGGHRPGRLTDVFPEGQGRGTMTCRGNEMCSCLVRVEGVTDGMELALQLNKLAPIEIEFLTLGLSHVSYSSQLKSRSLEKGVGVAESTQHHC